MSYLINPFMIAATGTDPYFANVVSLLHFDGTDNSNTFTDVTGKGWTSPVSTRIDTGQSKFGGASGEFVNPGGVSYIYTASHADFSFGSGEFTVEFWIRFSTLAANSVGIVCRDQIGGTRGWGVFCTGSGDSPASRLSAFAWVGGSLYQATDTGSPSTGTWYHIAAVRDKSSGDVLRLYRDGVQKATDATITGSVGAPAEPCVVGCLWAVGSANSPLNDLQGWVDDLRITKGVCRYPGGTTFTPPTAAFPDS